MQSSFLTCPKCHHVRQAHETAEPECCPACGVYFAKWLQREETLADIKSMPRKRSVSADDDAGPIAERLTHIPDQLDDMRVHGSALLLALLTIWSYVLYSLDYRDGEMGTSFMHNILLPIHEAGHMLFMPFGEFMSVLGGSLFQLLLPLICTSVIFWQNRDTFGAGVGIWWAGTSLVNLAPYIYDAKEPQLVLLGGRTGEDGPHDWIYLLDSFARVQHSQSYGAFTHTLGLVVMLIGLGWAAHTLWRWRRHLRERDGLD